MLWLMAALGQIHGVKVKKAIVIPRMISLLLQHSCKQVQIQIQYLNRKKERETHFL